jgi:hypothetical protein
MRIKSGILGGERSKKSSTDFARINSKFVYKFEIIIHIIVLEKRGYKCADMFITVVFNNKL